MNPKATARPGRYLHRVDGGAGCCSDSGARLPPPLPPSTPRTAPPQLVTQRSAAPTTTLCATTAGGCCPGSSGCLPACPTCSAMHDRQWQRRWQGCRPAATMARCHLIVGRDGPCGCWFVGLLILHIRLCYLQRRGSPAGLDLGPRGPPPGRRSLMRHGCRPRLLWSLLQL